MGNVAVWADGKLLGHWAGVRYRNVPELRINMAHRRLGELCRAAARTVITVYRAVSGRPESEQR